MRTERYASPGAVNSSRTSFSGPKLLGKIHIDVGDDDSYYLDDAVELMEKFLESTRTPDYAGSVTCTRGAPHCNSPGAKELLDPMTQHIERTAPVGADIANWRYT